MSATNPKPSIVVREHKGRPFYEAFWRADGRQVKRRIGPAWLEPDGDGGWQRHRGRVPDGHYDERSAHVAAAALVAQHADGVDAAEQTRRARQADALTFRAVAHGYIEWLRDVKGAKPSVLADYRWLLAEPGVPYTRRGGKSAGHIMAALGDKPATAITTADIDAMLATIAKTNVGARTVNRSRDVVRAIYNHAIRSPRWPVDSNPATAADKRREPHPGVLAFYEPEDIEALARALATGQHRDPKRPAVTDIEAATRRHEDQRDAQVIRVAAYAGLRLGELLALRWRDVDFAGHVLTVQRAISAGVESTTKSGRVRRVPMPDQAATALDRLSRRGHYTSRDDLVFCNALGRTLDGSALRRRFKRARDAAGLRPLRFHDLRHTYGSLLAARGIDLVTIQTAMGHSDLATTSRYLHARPATEQAEMFTQAFKPASAPEKGRSRNVRVAA